MRNLNKRKFHLALFTENISKNPVEIVTFRLTNDETWV